MKKIFIHSQDSASDYYRAHLPYVHLRSKLAEIGVELTRSNRVSMDEHYDVYMFQRVINPSSFPALFKMKERGAVIVWDLDDDFWNIPDWSTAVHERWHIECLEECLKLADHVTVTVPPLGRVIVEKTGVKPPIMLPNLIDCEPYRKDAASNYLPKEDDKDSPIRVFWGGSTTHDEDLRQIEPAISKFNQMYSDKIQFIFAGYMPDYLVNYPNCIGIGAWHIKYHPAALRLVRPHFGLAPLCDHKFNNSKSNIKYLEMTMAGSIPICSDVLPYKHADCTKILYSEEDNPRWYDTINNFLGLSSCEQDDLYAYSYFDVRDNYSWQSDHAPRPWLDFFAQFS